MKLIRLLLATLALVLVPGFDAGAQHQGWSGSLVRLEVTQKQYDLLQPWVVRTRNEQDKNGLVIGEKAILTTARNLNDLTLIRIQRGGRGQWANGRIRWIDYHANLAVIEPVEDELLAGLKPAPLAKPVADIESKDIHIVRWHNGKIEARKAQFNEFSVKNGELSFVPHVHLLVNCELESPGNAEIAVVNGQVVGLVGAQAGNACKIIPSSFINSILEAREKGVYSGLGFFEFVWQPAENPSILDYLKLPGEPRGVVVIDVPSKRGQKTQLKKHDVILQVDGFDIDTQGDYLDPDYGHLSLENLGARGKWAGQTARLKIWRNGEEKELDYVLPVADYSNQLVPDQVYDRQPEYLLVGGLVFQPLTDDYLRVWGDGARNRAPFRLSFYNQEEASEERPAIVILSMVLPDPVNLGYEDHRYLVVNKINGRTIHRLKEVQDAFKHPDDGFNVVEFEKGSQISRMILDAVETEKGTRRVLERYGIPRDHHMTDLTGKDAPR